MTATAVALRGSSPIKDISPKMSPVSSFARKPSSGPDFHDSFLDQKHLVAWISLAKDDRSG